MTKALSLKSPQSHSDTCSFFCRKTEKCCCAGIRTVLRSAAACQVFIGVINIDRIDSHIFLGISSPPLPFSLMPEISRDKAFQTIFEWIEIMKHHMVRVELVQLLWKANWHYPNYMYICPLTLGCHARNVSCRYHSRNISFHTHMENTIYTRSFSTTLFEIANN